MKKLFLILLVSLVSLSAFSSEKAKVTIPNDIFETVKVNEGYALKYVWPVPADVFGTYVYNGDNVLPGKKIFNLHFLSPELGSGIPTRSSSYVYCGSTVKLIDLKIKKGTKLKAGDIIFVTDQKMIFVHESTTTGADVKLESMGTLLENLVESTGIYEIWTQSFNHWTLGWGQLVMIFAGCGLLFLAVGKGFEPLLLVPIGFGAILANIPLADIAGPNGFLGMIYSGGVETGLFPLVIFMGVGAMTDFGPLIANPKTSLLGAAAQTGIFFALIGAVALGQYIPGIDFGLKEAASIGIIGGADGPTAIFLTSKLAPQLLGSIAVAAYSYMALVPIIQPPIMKFFTTEKERKIKMVQTRHVSKIEKIIFPVLITLLCAFLLPDAAPLVGMLMFGNFMKECGVVDRLSDTATNGLINMVTIFLGLTVGSKLSADKFLNVETLGILGLGLIAFCIGTATGVLMAKFFNKFFKWNINPLIGAAGVSAVPMAARVVNKVGLEDDPHNFLLMHAMGPNVAGVIGSAVAAGVLLGALG